MGEQAFPKRLLIYFVTAAFFYCKKKLIVSRGLDVSRILLQEAAWNR